MIAATRYLLIIILCLSALTGCSLASRASILTPTASPAATENSTETDPTPASVEASAAPGWLADGTVSAGEYSHQGSAGPMTISWFTDGTYLYVALQARTTGWLAIGFDPDRTHIGADIIIGAVTNGRLTLLDSYGTSERGTFHTPDTALGGTTDIKASAGSYADGVTTIEFQIPLNSGDTNDKVLQAGQETGVILAVGATSNLTSMHTYATFGTLPLN